MYLNLGLPSRFVAHLWSLCVHVYISLVLHLATEHLSPGLKTSLQTDSQDTFNLGKKNPNISFLKKQFLSGTFLRL